MSLMNGVFYEYLDKFVKVFIDLFSDERGAQWTLEIGPIVSTRKQIVEKSIEISFNQSLIHYLGHIITGEGMTMGPMKVEAIMEWPAPTSINEVCSFMRLAGYYRRFVEGFSKIENPIT